ncbi:MAG: winged helix-turn-helix transcriptional regulator [Bdellovibrionales bacterium]|nr:winged helix-turn-helix transcriptional regulator [Bdellovibrionales bacterium]
MGTSDAVRALERFGSIRRQLNLVAVKLLKDHGLHPKQMVMLRFVSENNEVSLTQLARGTATDMAAASRAIGPLIKQGWLKKMRDPQDSRRWIIQLTPKAQRKMPAIEKIYVQLADLLCDPLDSREIKEFSRVLEGISQGLKAKLQA